MRGSLVPLVTPFRQGAFDEAAFRALIEWQIESGSHGLVITGTTGEPIADPDWQPIRWSVNDPRRATFWGHVPPASWFEEASPVESVVSGALIEPSPPALRDRPSFVT